MKTWKELDFGGNSDYEAGIFPQPMSLESLNGGENEEREIIKDAEIPIFTNIRDLDMKILQELDDHELYDICIVNKYANSLCIDENFWRNRFLKHYSQDFLKDNISKDNISKDKPIDVTWRKYYIGMRNIDRLKELDKYYIESRTSDRLKDIDTLYYLTPNAKLFFNTIDLGNYLGNPLTDNLIEKAGISSIVNLRRLLNYYKFYIWEKFRRSGYRGASFEEKNINIEKEISNIFKSEYEKFKIVGDRFNRENIEKIISLLISKPLSPNTLLYSKMYNLYMKEKEILKKLNI